MKNIRDRLIEVLRSGNCTPQISTIAKKIGEASTTIHYNIKQMERSGIILTYKAVLDHKKIDGGFCNFVLINLTSDEYGDPEVIAKELAKYDQIESVDIVTGDWELVIKVRTKDSDAYYEFIKNVFSRKGIAKVKSLGSLKQVKSEFVNI